MLSFIAFLFHFRSHSRRCGYCRERGIKSQMLHTPWGPWFCNADCQEAHGLEVRSW